ncbi:protein singed [Neisseria weixii]|nr:protein singed [Neisseria weixii]
MLKAPVMHNYIGLDEVDEALGFDWRLDLDGQRAVMLANLWLADRGVKVLPETPLAVKQAGIELAKLAATGKLYADKQTGLLSESVQADSVSVSQAFSQSAKLIHGELQVVEALIKPYVSVLSANGFVVPLIRM